MGASDSVGLDEAYRPLPALYFVLLSIWFILACSWAIITYKNRHFQTYNLQCTFASVQFIKALQLALSFLFWYWCFNLQICSLWISFGVYVTGVLFQTSSFVLFLLISHGYCITYERLSLTERRTTSVLGCLFYFTLVGYRASIPYFSVLLLLSYIISFYVIFDHISQNLLSLREQLTFIEDEDVHAMRDAVYTKYMMFKKFQGAMQIVATAETVMHLNMNYSFENYWLRLLVREWAHLCIFAYITWTFRSQDLTPGFSIMPALKSKGGVIVPPIYSIEMDAATFKQFSRCRWNIGVVCRLELVISFLIYEDSVDHRFMSLNKFLELRFSSGLHNRFSFRKGSLNEELFVYFPADKFFEWGQIKGFNPSNNSTIPMYIELPR